MKTITTILITLIFSATAFSQNCSTIYFAPKKAKGREYRIYMNEKLVGTIGYDENFEFKIFSEGRISYVLLYGVNSRIFGSVDVKNGNVYYLSVNGTFAKCEKVDKENGEKLLAKNKTTIKEEEDLKNPIGKLTTK